MRRRSREKSEENIKWNTIRHGAATAATLQQPPTTDATNYADDSTAALQFFSSFFFFGVGRSNTSLQYCLFDGYFYVRYSVHVHAVEIIAFTQCASSTMFSRFTCSRWFCRLFSKSKDFNKRQTLFLKNCIFASHGSECLLAVKNWIKPNIWPFRVATSHACRWDAVRFALLCVSTQTLSNCTPRHNNSFFMDGP